MTRFIKIGGVSLIVAVFAIFVFISWQIFPLLHDAKVEPLQSLALPPGDYKTVGADEWSEKPFLLDGNGRFTFVSASDGMGISNPAIPFESPKTISSFRYKPVGQKIVYGTEDGYFSLVSVNYSADYETKKRVIKYELKAGPWLEAGPDRWPVRAVDHGDAGSEKITAVIQEKDGVWKVGVTRLTQEQTLFGQGEMKVEGHYDLTKKILSRPTRVLVNSGADGVLVACADGRVRYFFRMGSEFELRQTIEPFPEDAGSGISSMEYIFGDVSAVFADEAGSNRIYSLFSAKEGDKRLFGRTKEFKSFSGPVEYSVPSSRNKAFLIGTADHASLRYSTTEEIRWEENLPFKTVSAVISGKFDKIFFLDTKNKLHLYSLHDPHPEASLKAFFGKIWYEGSPAPKYEWQSTGGSDEFEPKLSMIPLIIGTLKGTVYAMIFAVPIALLAALYTSQFLNSKIRAVAKPTMEVMASLPSVVLGFLAALWLAPLIEKKVPSILAMVVLVPLAACGLGSLFQQLPMRARQWVKSGFEFVVLFPVLLCVVWICWSLGPFIERIFFVATDPLTGQKAADFRLWWPQVTGASFEQRNSLAVGFMMGFAVIPIIFTIAEDSLSNVPSYLRSGSLALGASRWQTALFVVLPTAFPGIFSALMVGLGRAIGETMIVVMATGNTPIMDFNIFSGMRTLSANIAVELPEAPHHGTLYRTLFLGALLLFMATFVVNTVAEVLRQRIREKYKTV